MTGREALPSGTLLGWQTISLCLDVVRLLHAVLDVLGMRRKSSASSHGLCEQLPAVPTLWHIIVTSVELQICRTFLTMIKVNSWSSTLHEVIRPVVVLVAVFSANATLHQANHLLCASMKSCPKLCWIFDLAPSNRCVYLFPDILVMNWPATPRQFFIARLVFADHSGSNDWKTLWSPPLQVTFSRPLLVSFHI